MLVLHYYNLELFQILVASSIIWNEYVDVGANRCYLHNLHGATSRGIVMICWSNLHWSSLVGLTFPQLT